MSATIALRDITLGRLSAEQQGDPLTPFTVVIGKNGVGKSTLFDAFGFVADCLSKDVESACDDKQRGGFERMRSLGTEESIRFDIYYREAKGERPITYELAINLDSSGRPFVESEVLKQRRKGQKHGRPTHSYACITALERYGLAKKRWKHPAAKKIALKRMWSSLICASWELQLLAH